MPTGVYDPGVPPPKWEMDPALLPLYPGSKQFGSKFTFITEDPVSDVVGYYKEKLPDAEVVDTRKDNPASIFKTAEFIIEIGLDESGENTIIQFKESGV
jgi:hypothetical protein